MIQQEIIKIPLTNLALEDLGMYTKVGQLYPTCSTIPFTFRKSPQNTQIYQFKSSEDKLNFLKYFIFDDKVTLDSKLLICGSTMNNEFKNHWSDYQPITSLSGGWYQGTINDLEKFHENIIIYQSNINFNININIKYDQEYLIIHKSFYKQIDQDL